VDVTGVVGAGDLKKHVDVSVPPGVTVVRIAPEEVDVVMPPKQKN